MPTYRVDTTGAYQRNTFKEMKNDPIKILELQIAENAKTAGIEVYPCLYIMVATTPDNRIMLYNEIHYTREEAIATFQKNLELPGMPAHTWTIKIIACISADLLESKFKEYADKMVAEKKREKNELMAEIIANKDTNLLHRHYARFTKAEILYLHDKIVGPTATLDIQNL